MADIDLKTETPDASINDSAILFGADSQASANPSVYSVATVRSHFVGAGTLNVASGKTLTASNTLTLAGTDGTTMTFPTTSATLARTDAGNTFTGAQTFSVGTVNGTGLDLTQTWGATGTYTGLKYNVTDSGPSNAASLLLDLQRGGVSQFRVDKTGLITQAANGAFVAANVFTTSGFSIRYTGSDRVTIRDRGGVDRISFRLDNSPAVVAPTFALGSAGDSATGTTFLTQRAAANLRLGAADAAAPVAQTLSVQSVVAGTSDTAGANLTITGSQGTGTGAGGSIIFQVAPAGSSGTAQNALATALTINSLKQVVLSEGLALENYTNTSHITIRNPNGQVTSIRAIGSDSRTATISFNNNAIQFPGSRVETQLDGSVDHFVSTSANGVTTWFRLASDGVANTLAPRNGTNAQTFNVYNTFTSSTNFERFRIFAQSAAAVLIGTEKGSAGGTARALELQTDGTTRLTIATTGASTFSSNVTVGTSSNGLIFDTGLDGIRNWVGGGIKWELSNYGLYLTSNVNLSWSNSTSTAKSVIDTILARDDAGKLALRNGTNAQELRVYGSYTSETNFQRMSIKTLRESSGALSGATYVSTIAIPAYAVPVGVTTRVTTAITGATSYDVGDGTDADLWGNDIGITLGSQSRTADFTAIAAVDAAATARTVTLTANGSNFTGGVVEICVHYLTTEAD